MPGFLKAFQNFSQLRGIAFRPWLLKIVTNTWYDKMRRDRYRQAIPLEPEDENGEENESPAWLADPRPQVAPAVEQRELFDRIDRAIGDLSEEYRVVITLVDINGLDYAEAAQILGTPLGTLKSRLARARFQVRRKLQAGLKSAVNF